jgi:hypothetical protein
MQSHQVITCNPVPMIPKFISKLTNNGLKWAKCKWLSLYSKRPIVKSDRNSKWFKMSLKCKELINTSNKYNSWTKINMSPSRMQTLHELIIQSRIRINTTRKPKWIRCKVQMNKSMTTFNMNRYLKESKVVHHWQVHLPPFTTTKKWAQWNRIRFDHKNNQWYSSLRILLKWRVKRIIRLGRVLQV